MPHMILLTCADNSISCQIIVFLLPVCGHSISDLWSDQSSTSFKVRVRNRQFQILACYLAFSGGKLGLYFLCFIFFVVGSNWFRLWCNICFTLGLTKIVFYPFCLQIDYKFLCLLSILTMLTYFFGLGFGPSWTTVYTCPAACTTLYNFWCQSGLIECVSVLKVEEIVI